ncbi:hypothetical protein EBX93_16100 [bacterium]|nr:hypothetical protein [bacterium]
MLFPTFLVASWLAWWTRNIRTIITCSCTKFVLFLIENDLSRKDLALRIVRQMIFDPRILHISPQVIEIRDLLVHFLLILVLLFSINHFSIDKYQEN